MKKHTPRTIDATKLTEEQRERFVGGWMSAGGFVTDCNSDSPWCAPWTRGEDIRICGDDYASAGAAYWCAVKDEALEALRASEEEDEE